MPRFAMTTLLALTLAIGSLVGVLAWRSMSDPPVTTDLASADPAIGYAFYDAIGQVLAGGDASALQQVLAAGFLDHGGDGTGDRSAIELIDALTALSQTFPGASMTVHTIEAASGTLVASVDPLQLDGATVAGVPFSVPSHEPHYELLKVQGGKVLERWSEDAPAIELQTFPDAAPTMGGTFASSMRLDRIELQKHASVEFYATGAVVLLGEAGVTRVGLIWANSLAQPQSAVHDLQAGESLRIPDGARVRLEPDGSEAARLLRYAVQLVRPTDPPAPKLTGNVTFQLLWASVLPVLGDGDWAVSIGHLLLPADADAELAPRANETLLLCPDAGALELMAKGGEISTLGSDRWPLALGSSADIDANRVASIEGASKVELQGTADAPAWLIVITRNQAVAPLAPKGTPMVE